MNNKFEKRKTRSDSYQHILLETVCSNDMMEAFRNEDSIYHRLNPFEYNEDLMDLEDQLKKEFWRVVDTLLTPRQKEVIKLYADGYTQMEIAKMLNVNQSSITKSLNGNVDYKNGKRVYGGARKKIRKIIENDERIKEILKKMDELRAEKW
jgi:DNA-binding CsgD family transcriptional regulator